MIFPCAVQFDPRRIAGCGLWLDAHDRSTMSQTSDGSTPVTNNNDPVGYWRDKASGLIATQTVDANRALWSGTAINGRPGLVFDGSNDTLSLPSYTQESGLAGLTRIAVYSSTQNCQVARANGTSDVAFFFSNNEIVSRVSATAGTASASVTAPLPLRVVASVYAGGGSPTMKILYNTATQSSQSSGFITTALPSNTASGTGTFWIGSNSAANNFVNGPIGDYLVYLRAISDGELLYLIRGLMEKHNIT